MNDGDPTLRPGEHHRRRRPSVGEAPSHPPLAAALLMIGVALFIIAMSVVAVL